MKTFHPRLGWEQWEPSARDCYCWPWLLIQKLKVFHVVQMSQDNVAARLASHMEPDQGKEQQQSELEQINCQRGLIWASRHRYYYWSVAFLSLDINGNLYGSGGKHNTMERDSNNLCSECSRKSHDSVHFLTTQLWLFVCRDDVCCDVPGVVRLRRLSGAWHQRRQDTITTSSSDEQISVGETPVEQTLTRVRSDTSPVGASLQEMYGLVSKNRDNNEKVSNSQ